jgi:transcriptional regulatory protein LevR
VERFGGVGAVKLIDDDDIDVVDAASETFSLAREALTLLEINLDHGSDVDAREKAYVAAGIDVTTSAHTRLHVLARIAAVLLLHGYAEAESFGIRITHPIDLLRRYEMLIPPSDEHE